jgi:hypothetical protein
VRLEQDEDESEITIDKKYIKNGGTTPRVASVLKIITPEGFSFNVRSQ